MISCPTDSSTIQLYLDKALSLLARKWSNHTRMGELRIYFDELDNVNFFNLKKYYNDLATRDGNLFKVLLHSFKSKKKDIELKWSGFSKHIAVQSCSSFTISDTHRVLMKIKNNF